MFNLNNSLRYWLYPFPTDMRKSFYTLSGIVRDRMGRDIRHGDVFIFIGRTLSSMKILHMESGGLVIYHFKLEEGSFSLPAFDEKSREHPCSWRELMHIAQGVDPGKCRRGKRWEKPVRT